MLPPLPRCSGWAYSSLISPSRVSLPRKGRRVGLHIDIFEACSAFTRVAACTLALSPIRDTLIEGFSHFVASMTAPIASGWSESPGGTCTHWKAPPCHGAPPKRPLYVLVRNRIMTCRKGADLRRQLQRLMRSNTHARRDGLPVPCAWGSDRASPDAGHAETRRLDRRSFIAGLAGGMVPGLGRAEMLDAAGLRQAARDAWLYVLPPIELAALRAGPSPFGGAPAPVNLFRHGRQLAGPASRAVTSPNNDTLYSSAFIDTTKGPVRLEVPDCGRRYLSVQVMDMYTNNNFNLGRR